MKKTVFLIGLITITNIFALVPCFADTVIYNTKTGKIHSPYCKWAQKCTVNCIKTDRKEAVKKGGVPCKVCGGK